MHNRLQKNQYINDPVGVKKRNANIYPPYILLMMAKKACYPENIHVSEKLRAISHYRAISTTPQSVFSICSASRMYHLTRDSFKWYINGDWTAQAISQCTNKLSPVKVTPKVEHNDVCVKWNMKNYPSKNLYE